EEATTIYIPTFAATQVASSLSPKDKRILAIQGELRKTRHAEFRSMFLARYRDAYHLSPIEGASKGHQRGSRDELLTPPGNGCVDNQGDSEGHRRGNALVPVNEDKRGPGREEEGEGHRRGLLSTTEAVDSAKRCGPVSKTNESVQPRRSA